MSRPAGTAAPPGGASSRRFLLLVATLGCWLTIVEWGTANAAPPAVTAFVGGGVPTASRSSSASGGSAGNTFWKLSAARVTSSAAASSSSSSTAQPPADDDDSGDFSSFAASMKENGKPQQPGGGGGGGGAQKKDEAKKKKEAKSWQADLEELLDPKTKPGQRQVLLQELVSANQDIRESVEKALKDRNIDPLLTPTGKKLQAGTRAVARQISSDILPSIAASTSTASGTGRETPGIPEVPDLTKVGGRVFKSLQNQFQRNLETLQGDLADPRRIPQRLTEQTEEFVKEAANVFSETPAGLKEPPYTAVSRTDDYEIRDYEAYKVASTNMAVDSPGEVYRVGNVAQTGAAFNSLAAYLFGANRDSKTMDMTTPVTTTMGGEMRFYLADGDTAPDPLEQDESKSAYETDSIRLEDIPPARLAVRRFTGFVTDGEIARQKEALLTALELDGVELDVPHGQTVGHVVFQYNPPYTLPVLRRNEIAVPVVGESSEVEARLGQQPQQDPWDVKSSGESSDIE